MHIYDDTFPLLVAVLPRHYDAQAVREMDKAYERYFVRNQRYTVLNITPRDATPPDAKARKLITDWTNSPRVHDCSKRLCIGSATVISSTLTRGALTAMLWFWKPPSPLRAVAGVDEGLDYCFELLCAERLPLHTSEAAARKLVTERLKAVA